MTTRTTSLYIYHGTTDHGVSTTDNAVTTTDHGTTSTDGDTSTACHDITKKWKLLYNVRPGDSEVLITSDKSRLHNMPLMLSLGFTVGKVLNINVNMYI